MRNFIIFTFILSSFALFSCSVKQEKEEYADYRNAGLGIELTYPSSWEKTEISEKIIFFKAPEKDGFDASFALFADDENLDILNKTQKEYFEENKDSIPGFKIISFQKTSISGEDCIAAAFDSERDREKLRQKQYILNHNGKLFMLIFTSPQKNYGYYEAVFDKIAASFAFTD